MYNCKILIGHVFYIACLVHVQCERYIITLLSTDEKRPHDYLENHLAIMREVDKNCTIRPFWNLSSLGCVMYGLESNLSIGIIRNISRVKSVEIVEKMYVASTLPTTGFQRSHSNSFGKTLACTVEYEEYQSLKGTNNSCDPELVRLSFYIVQRNFY